MNSSFIISSLKQLGKDSVVYGIGTVIAKGITFLMLPVYTRLFSPEEYGLIELFIVINSFISMLLVMGIDSSQSYYFFDQQTKGKSAQAVIVSATLQWRLLWGGGVVICVLVFNFILKKWQLIDYLTTPNLVVACAWAFLAQIMNHNAEVLRLLYRPWHYIAIFMGEACIAASLTVLLIVYGKLGILGYFLGAAISSLMMALLGFYAIRDYIKWTQLYYNWWPKLLRFGVPIFLSNIGLYALYNGDRWFVAILLKTADLGLYAVGAKFGMALSIVINTFRQAWWPIAMGALNSDDAKGLFITVTEIYITISIVLAILITVFSKVLVTLLVSDSFYNAYQLIGILCWVPVFYGLYMIISIGILKKEKPALSIIPLAIAGSSSIFFAIMLVPRYGLIGAASGTVLSFIVWISISYVISQKLWHINYPLFRLILQIVIGLLATVLITAAHFINASLWLIFLISFIAIFFLFSNSRIFRISILYLSTRCR